MPLTPCINVCKLDTPLQNCIGCYRTLKEIQEWSSLDDETRLLIMGKLKDRKNESRSTVDITDTKS
jgi:predicted Fe-S protein YdhL (DUF1289 family)